MMISSSGDNRRLVIPNFSFAKILAKYRTKKDFPVWQVPCSNRLFGCSAEQFFRFFRKTDKFPRFDFDVLGFYFFR